MPSDPRWNQILKCGLIPTASLTISNKQILMCKWLLIFEETLSLSQKLISNDRNWNLIRFKVQTANKAYENSAGSLITPVIQPSFKFLWCIRAWSLIMIYDGNKCQSQNEISPMKLCLRLSNPWTSILMPTRPQPQSHLFFILQKVSLSFSPYLQFSFFLEKKTWRI